MNWRKKIEKKVECRKRREERERDIQERDDHMESEVLHRVVCEQKITGGRFCTDGCCPPPPGLASVNRKQWLC